MVNLVEWSTEEFFSFKAKYNKAVVDKKESFTFQKELYNTLYAKYVIEYLTPKYEHSKTK